MKISVVCPVLDEAPWIGYSIMAALPWMHEFIYALDEKSSDGTRELLRYVKDHYAHEKLVILEHPNFHPLDMKAYNAAFNRCIGVSTGQACMFLHPDMIITKGVLLKQGPQAWFTHITSFAGDMQTVITKGRATLWKNIHARRFGLHYFGAYGSQNEDFYHADVTGKSYKHFGTEFSKYPFEVTDSGIGINHYCEVKGYRRRLEKMKFCLKTLAPNASEAVIEESAVQHPRVSLEPSSLRFGEFKFEPTADPLPEVFQKYPEFQSFAKKEDAWPFPAQQSKPPHQMAPTFS